MINIRTIEYSIHFLTNIDFVEDPEIAIFKCIFKKLKNILCINSKEKCIECSYGKKCVYNYVTAGDFMHINLMPVIIKKPLISKKHFKQGDRLKLKFLFLGDAALHMDFVDFILKGIEVKGLFKEKHRFFIESRTIDDTSIDINNHRGIYNIEILTPIDKTEDIFLYEKEKIEDLNKLYNITDEPIEIIEEFYDKDFIKFKVKRPIYLGSNRINLDGYIGRLSFIKPIPLTPLLLIAKQIGIGKYYGIGGGCIEF